MSLSVPWLLVFAAAVGLAVYATRPPSARSRTRERALRERYLRRWPTLAAYQDVESVLLAAGMPGATVSEVCGLALDGGMPAPLLWRWADRHGPALLVLALGAGLGRHDLESTLEDATGLDVESLEILCSVHGRPLAHLTEASASRGPAPDLSGFGSGWPDAGRRAA